MKLTGYTSSFYSSAGYILAVKELDYTVVQVCGGKGVHINAGAL